MGLLLTVEYRTKKVLLKKLHGALFGAFFCAVLSLSSGVSADPVRPLSDRQFDKACVEMTGEYEQDVTQKQAERNPYITHRLILKSDDAHLDPDDYGAVDAIQNKDGMYVMQFNSTPETRRAKRLLEKESATEYVEPDYLLFACSESEDISLYGSGAAISAADNDFWNISMVGLDGFQKKIKDRNLNKEVIVAVLDTGISYSHSLLKNCILTSKARSFVDGCSANEDALTRIRTNHGTHVAGIIAKSTNLLSVKILPVRVLNSVNRGGSVSQLYSGIRYAVDCGAQVISMSIAGEGAGSEDINTIRNAVVYAIEHGVVVVASSGNGNKNIIEKNVVPAIISECIVVGAVNNKKQIWDSGSSGSNYGNTVDVVAPGVSVLSSVLNNNYAADTGTSMAAPHVSAQAAMLKMVYPDYSAQQIEKLIQQTATDLGPAGKDDHYGYGLAQVSLPSYTISYKPGEHGTFAVTSSTVEYGLSTPAAPAVTGESGYQFTGWSPSIRSTVTGDATYVAQWKYLYENSNPHANLSYIVPLKTKQSTDRLRVEGLAGSDTIISWVSSNPIIVTVSGGADGGSVVRAGKKKGSATVTATTASQRQISFYIKVQKKKVKTKKILISSSTIVLKAGEVFQLEPTLYPVSSTDKIKYKSKKKKVASVTGSGMITAKKKGKTKIYIYSGKKKKKINVIVQ